MRLDAVAEALVGTRLEEASRPRRRARGARDIEPLSDLHASAAYRRRVAATLAVRAIIDAHEARRRARMRVELTVNGQTHAVEVEPRTSLLDCLREQLGLTGAHAGCEHGVCGACTVLLDGAPVRSCLMFAVQADGYAITTIEGAGAGTGRALARSRTRSARRTACSAATARRR